MIYSIRKKKILQVKIKKNIKNVIYDYEFWKKAVIIDTKLECFGIVGMAAVNMKDGLVKLLKKDYLTHGINVSVNEDNKITIDFHVIVSYGVSISTVTDNLIETVRYKVEEFTGMEIEKINIYVEGVRVID